MSQYSQWTRRAVCAAALTPLVRAVAALSPGRAVSDTGLNDAESAPLRRWDLTPFADAKTVLKNPHKGWYHHYFDNGIHGYKTRKDSDLEGFPGLDHLYLRLAWMHLEPEEGKFHRPLID